MRATSATYHAVLLVNCHVKCMYMHNIVFIMADILITPLFSDGGRELQEVLILEDDVDFEPNFHDDLEQVLEEAHRLAPQWDLM